MTSLTRINGRRNLRSTLWFGAREHRLRADFYRDNARRIALQKQAGDVRCLSGSSNGMISVVICQRNDNDWYVDTWLMSCRVLGRRVEEAILRELLSEARRRRIDRIIGAYRPTARNKMVENHYAKLGFSMMKTGDDGTVLWELDVAGRPAEDRPIPITVERFGFDLVEAD